MKIIDQNKLSILETKISGCLIGCAVGDAFGLSCEGMSKNRQRKMFPKLEGYYFLFNKGMVSDDTEHICITAQSLINSAGDYNIFKKSLAWKLKFWLLGLPAGVGLATLKALIKLWLGFSPEKSGVFSAGNGPAMRSPIIGVCYGHDIEKLKEIVKISTSITHTDPKAFYGALTVAYAAYLASNNNDFIQPEFFLNNLKNILEPDASEMINLIEKVVCSLNLNQTSEEFAESMGFKKGVSGYIYQTVPIVIHCWLRNQDQFIPALKEIIRCGGDTDTTGAILGAIIGSKIGGDTIPQKFKDNLFELPRNINWIKKVSKRLSEVCLTDNKQHSIYASPSITFLRNIFFMIIVIIHIIRRMLPPY